MSLCATEQAGDWALFLDVDGTLLKIAETPQSVRVPPALTPLLQDLFLRLDGALALISGRTIANLDALFAPLKLCAAGVHGCERREANGCIVTAPVDAVRLEPARRRLAEFVGQHTGLLLEDKRYGLAVHFRRVPELAPEVRSQVQAARELVGEDYSVLKGKCVFELRPTGWTKGTAIAAHMSSPPFIGRTPVFIGDDDTDEEGFAVVHQFRGITIKVGQEPGTLAQYRLPSVDHVHRWLRIVPPARVARVRS